MVASVATNPDEMTTCGVNVGTVDISIALDHLTLPAAEEGLGACRTGAFDQKKTKEILNIPDEYKVIVLMSLAYPAPRWNGRTKQRKSLDEIINYNRFGGP